MIVRVGPPSPGTAIILFLEYALGVRVFIPSQISFNVIAVPSHPIPSTTSVELAILKPKIYH